MTFSSSYYDPEMLAALTGAFDAAWLEARRAHPSVPADSWSTERQMMALRILEFANMGERDPVHLKAFALQAVEDREGPHAFRRRVP